MLKCLVLTMYNVLIPNKVDKMITKIGKSDKENLTRILFTIENLKNAQDPFALKNCKKMEGYENIYRWKVGQNYRIIGEKIKETLTLKLIKVSTRESAYK